MLAPTTPYLHGVGFGLGLAPWRHLGLGVTFDLTQPAHLEAGAGRATLSRWSVRFVASAWFVVNRVSLGLNVGPVIESLRIHDLSYEPSDPDATDPRASAALGVSARIQFGVLPWFAPYIEAGGDFYFGTTAVLVDDEVIIERCPTIPRICLGVAFILRPA